MILSRANGYLNDFSEEEDKMNLVFNRKKRFQY